MSIEQIKNISSENRKFYPHGVHAGKYECGCHGFGGNGMSACKEHEKFFEWGKYFDDWKESIKTPVGTLRYEPGARRAGSVDLEFGFNYNFHTISSYAEETRKLLDKAIEYFEKFGFSEKLITYKDYEDQGPYDTEIDMQDSLNDFLTKKFLEYAEEKDREERARKNEK